MGLMLLALAACGTRSISDSGYYADSDRAGPGAHNPFYKGELSELDVLGIDRSREIPDSEIEAALAAKQPLMLRKGSSLLLVQSGAMMPDDAMVRAFERYYTVGVFSGVPDGASGPAAQSGPYAKALRLAAAQGGYETIVAYWGVLETAQENLVTKTVSWVPIIGSVIPDETQQMRIRLKVAIVDVKSGQWEMFAPEPIADDSLSARLNRISSDQQQVALLKDAAYAASAEDFVKRYAQ
jgi:hypothetical protein